MSDKAKGHEHRGETTCHKGSCKQGRASHLTDWKPGNQKRLTEEKSLKLGFGDQGRYLCLVIGGQAQQENRKSGKGTRACREEKGPSSRLHWVWCRREGKDWT